MYYKFTCDLIKLKFAKLPPTNKQTINKWNKNYRNLHISICNGNVLLDFITKFKNNIRS